MRDIFTEYSFSVNDFNEPRVFKDAEGIMMLLTRLLLLDPGTIQSHPDMGVGLVSKYRYSMEGEEYNLRSAFQDQIRKYLPNLQAVQVQVKFKEYTYYITATIDNVIYGFTYNIETGNLITQYSNLADL